jgi:hypothetical protein
MEQGIFWSEQGKELRQQRTGQPHGLIMRELWSPNPFGPARTIKGGALIWRKEYVGIGVIQKSLLKKWSRNHGLEPGAGSAKLKARNGHRRGSAFSDSSSRRGRC